MRYTKTVMSAVEVRASSKNSGVYVKECFFKHRDGAFIPKTNKQTKQPFLNFDLFNRYLNFDMITEYIFFSS